MTATPAGLVPTALAVPGVPVARSSGVTCPEGALLATTAVHESANAGTAAAPYARANSAATSASARGRRNLQRGSRISQG